MARPEGTDGSDYSYRMLVEERYKIVPRYRKYVSILLPANLITCTLGTLWALVPWLEGWDMPPLAKLLLPLQLLLIMMWHLAKPGHARERLNILKAAGIGCLLQLGLHLLRCVAYHWMFSEREGASQFPKMLAPVLAQNYGWDADSLVGVLETAESTLHGGLALALGAQWLLLHKLVLATMERTEAKAADAPPKAIKAAAAAAGNTKKHR